jgi:hypothetical protein
MKIGLLVMMITLANLAFLWSPMTVVRERLLSKADQAACIAGGACGLKCQNACQTKVSCGTCQDYQSEGENCPGGGGGSGSAFRCVSTDQDLECRQSTTPPVGRCDPQKVCRCDASDPPECKEFNSGNVEGSQQCVSERCSS